VSSTHRQRFDVVSLANGVGLAVLSAFFLLADDPGLEDVATLLFPIVLLAAGAALLLGSLRRSDDEDDARDR
jgi:hypothetical protein